MIENVDPVAQRELWRRRNQMFDPRTNSRGAREAGDEDRRLQRAGQSAEELTQAFINLRRYLDSMPHSANASSPVTAPTAGDAYMTSSGFLPFQVSQGDLLVNRNSLANAMVSGPGGLAPPTPASLAGETAARSSNQGMRADVRFEIPVNIDGREIARIIGNRVLDMDQRRGVTVEPGRRERVAQHGA